MYLYDYLENIISNNEVYIEVEMLNELFKKEVESAEKDTYGLHALSLQQSLYHLNMVSWGVIRKNNIEFSIPLLQLRQRIENFLLKFMDSKFIVPTLPEFESHDFKSYLVDLINNHPAANHPVYKQLIPFEWDRQKFKEFFVQESTMDINTDDFLALLQLGCDKNIKTEIAHNFWDEMGRGKVNNNHGVLFNNILTSLGISTNIKIRDIKIESLICGNLQILTSQYRSYLAFGIGFFFTSEYLASPRFIEVEKGWDRLDLPKEGKKYHLLHIPLDVVHADNWFKHVLYPFIEQYPDQKKDVLKGVYYRLESSNIYLDSLV